MTTIAVLANPPREGVVLPELVDNDVLSESQAVSLYRAMVGDVCESVVKSGGELLVNYRPADQLPAGTEGTGEPEAELRAVVDDALPDVDEIRYEVQVGSTFAARVGNTVTHLLRDEDVQTAAAVTPVAAFLARQHIDSAAMKLRRSDVVLGPSTDGRVYYVGFAAPIAFSDAYEPPAVETLVERAGDAGHTVDFLPMLPVLETWSDLQTLVPILRARSNAGRQIPSRTAAVLADLNIE